MGKGTKSVAKAYGLWLAGGFGWLGLHRLYLHKKKTARLWQVTFGLAGLGSLADLFFLWWLVKRHNTLVTIRELQRQLQEVEKIKSQQVAAQHFEAAAHTRNAERELEQKIAALKKTLGAKTQHQQA